jgi:protocatechuate 3,4-dioxygenase beta subunit
VRGRVLDPEGKAAAGAKIYLISAKHTGTEPVARADADGKFQVALKPEEVGPDGRLLAAAEGCGPDWVDLARVDKGEVTFRLRKDDVPVTGRVQTLEGQPVVGAVVEVERLGRPAEGDQEAWLANNARLRKEQVWMNERGLLTVSPSAFGARLSAVTDKDGAFRLTGAGRDRVLALRVRGRDVEHKFFWAVTHADAPKDGYIKTGNLNYGVYGPELTVLVGPAKPIVGTVRDRATGKPVAGVMVQETERGVSTAYTDADGAYRLEGVPKKAFYYLTAAGKEGVPYFDGSRHAVTDTAGFDPLTVDFRLDRGVEITGRVVDADTGQPIAASVHYAESEDNPNRPREAPGEVRVLISRWGRTRPDGTYTVLALPGPGSLSVCAQAPDRYPLLDAARDLERLKVKSNPAAPVHAIAAVDADRKKPASLVHNFELRAGKARKVTVVGPDGKPLEGVQAAGLEPGGRPAPLSAATVSVSGLSARKRVLLFLQPEAKLGAVAVLNGESDEAVTVRLRPLGTVEGRVLDGDGKPWPGLRVRLTPEPPEEAYDNLPDELHAFQGAYGIWRGLWSGFLGRDAVTDRDGRFRLEGVLPGVAFGLFVSDGDLARERTLTASRRRVQVEAGKTSDLGTLKKGEGVSEK